MKIMILSNLYPPYVLGGYEILCEQVVDQLTERGHDVKVLTSDHQDSQSDERIERSLSIYKPFDQKAGLDRSLRNRTAIYNEKVTAGAIVRTAPDVIFIWSLLRLTPGPARAAESSGIPVYYTFNDENIASFAAHRFSLSPTGLIHWFFDRFITPKITLNDIAFEHTTCISEVTKQNIIAKGVPIDSCEVIYQGIPLDRFPKRKSAAGTVHSPIRLLYAGQLHQYKGVHTILEALKLLGEANVRLSIAGAGDEDYERTLKDLAEGLECPVEFLGRVAHDQMPGLYREHDLFIFPSIWQEPFGLTHLEAMASGLPVISTVNGGQGEFLTDEQNCLTFSPDTPEELVEALRRMIGDLDLRKSIAAAGRKTAVEGFSFTRYVDEIEAFISGNR